MKSIVQELTEVGNGGLHICGEPDRPTIDLYDWQEDVLNEIDKHQSRRDSDDFQGAPDYVTSKELALTIAMPRKSGHTFLANVIASRYPSMVIYGKMEHYKEITSRFPLNKDTETVSMYEIHYAIHRKSLNMPSPELLEMGKKIEKKKVVVIDNGLSVSDEIKNFVYFYARGIVIILGH